MSERPHCQNVKDAAETIFAGAHTLTETDIQRIIQSHVTDLVDEKEGLQKDNDRLRNFLVELRRQFTEDALHPESIQTKVYLNLQAANIVSVLTAKPAKVS